MNVLCKCDARWVALLFDTEGTITVNAGGPHAQVSVGMTSLPVLHELERLVGHGSVRARSTVDGHRQMYQWQIGSQRAGALLRQIEPYLFEKRRQARLCLALCDRLSSKQRHGRGVPDDERAHRDRMISAVQRLNAGQHVDDDEIEVLCRPYTRAACANGHPWAAPHLVTTSAGRIVCRTCRNEQQLRRYHEQSA